jgi:hypothetical protein
MWTRISTIAEYPKWVKYCTKITSFDFVEGGHFIDVTNILIVPLSIDHTIVSLRPGKEVIYSMPLPLGGQMLQTFQLHQDGPVAVADAKIGFDLGNPIYNATVAYFLAPRLRRMILGFFPEITDVTRIT